MNRMNRIAILAAAAMFATPPAQAQDKLYQLGTAGAKVENGKTLDMHYQEVTRDARSSIVEVTRKSGGSVSSSMFILGASCGLARARGEKFFRAVPLSRSPERFRIEFVAEAGPADLRPARIADKVFSLEECKMLGA